MYKLAYAIGFTITTINYSFRLAYITGKTAAHSMFMRLFNG